MENDISFFCLPLQWNLVCDNSWQIPVHNICFVTGWILGYIVLGALCDRYVLVTIK